MVQSITSENRAVIKGCNPTNAPAMTEYDHRPLMLQVNLSFVDRLVIHLKWTKFVVSVKNKATTYSKLDDKKGFH